MNQSTSAFSALIDVFVDPKKAFEGLDANPGWFWMVFILIIVTPMALTTYYFQTVDIAWLVGQAETAAEAAGTPLPEEAKAFMTAGAMTATTAIGQLIIIPVIFVIWAVYLNLVNKFTMNDTRGFKNWFSLSIFAAAPNLLASIAALVYFMVSGTNQISLEDVQFFSANSLITHYPTGHSAATFMGSITPFMFWNIALMTIGIKAWTKRSFMKSLMISLAPYIVIYGAWSYSAFG
ncbi:MAG: hypothetical protein COB37_05655 [Kordiimonadales bacterium]|nr:MAG: hypothetical protein COB37_05655 [Kordiimonadales bacterium]